MADSISHSVFIFVAQRGIKRNAHINQRAEHSSPERENLRLTRTTPVMDEQRLVHSLFFLFAQVLFAR
jgi:hypothetical protein